MSQSSVDEMLRHLHMTASFMNGGRVMVRINGAQILPAHYVEIVAHEPAVARWFNIPQKSGSARIWVDDDIAVRRRYALSVAAHEILEKWLKNTFFLRVPFNSAYSRCHRIAQGIEREFHTRKWGRESWDTYSRLVSRVHAKETTYAAEQMVRRAMAGKRGKTPYDERAHCPICYTIYGAKDIKISRIDSYRGDVRTYEVDLKCPNCHLKETRIIGVKKGGKLEGYFTTHRGTVQHTSEKQHRYFHFMKIPHTHIMPDGRRSRHTWAKSGIGKPTKKKRRR